MLKTLTPNLLVDDMDRTIDFYTNVLRFEILATVPEAAPFNWAMLKRDGVSLMFQTRASLSEEIPGFATVPVGGSQTFYIDVDQVEPLYQSLKGRVTVVQDLHTAFYGAREFAFRDCNGYVLVFAETAAAGEPG